MFHPVHLWRWLVAVGGFLLFLLRGTCIALGDFWVLYTRSGRVYQQPRFRAPSLMEGDLVMQLSAHSPTHSRVCVKDELLHLNADFVDRGLWKGLSETGTAPSFVVTGVSYGGIGFYTALHLMLAGVNVHGVVRSSKKGEEAAQMLQGAVDRQRRLHKEWAGEGNVGRIMIHVCDMSDTVAVAKLADTLFSDPYLRGIVCNAGPMATPLKLSPQRLEEQFATHHVGHSLLLLRILQARLDATAATAAVRSPQQKPAAPIKAKGAHGVNGRPAMEVDEAVRQQYAGPNPPRWRIIITSSMAAATAHPTDMTTFHTWRDTDEVWPYLSRFTAYGNAKMCEQLFAYALARHVQTDRRLSPYCTVNVLHPGSIRSRVMPNSRLPMCWLTDGEAAALFRMTPVIASLYVTDLCLSRRYEQTTGHFFRMGEDQTEYYRSLVDNAPERRGFFRNSTLWPGVPGPRVALSPQKQEWLWDATLHYLDTHQLVDATAFQR